MAGALTQIRRFVDTKTTIPALGMVRLRAHTGDILYLESTDLEVSTVFAVEASGLGNPDLDAPGLALVEPKRLLQIAKAAGKGDLRIETTAPGSLTVTSDAGAIQTLNTPRDEKTGPMTAQDFPTLPSMSEPSEPLTVDGKEFCTVLRRILPAVSSGESKFQLSGALLSPQEGDHLNLVSTDGHRLHIEACACEHRTGLGGEGLLVPRGLLSPLAAMPAGWTRGPLRWTNSMRHVAVWGESFCLVSRILEGTFPDYMRILKHDAPVVSMKVDPAALIAALDSVTPTMSKNRHAVRATCNGRIELVATNGTDTSTAVCPVLESTGVGEVVLGINPFYVRDVLVHADGPVGIDVWDENSQTRIHRGSFDSAIMPIRL